MHHAHAQTYALPQRAALFQYRQTRLAGDLENRSPHRSVALLLECARDRVGLAQSAIARRDWSEKAYRINQALAIFDGLKSALDLDAGGDIARNLRDLYSYMGQRLAVASAGADVQALAEVDRLLGELGDAWNQIPQALRHG